MKTIFLILMLSFQIAQARADVEISKTVANPSTVVEGTISPEQSKAKDNENSDLTEAKAIKAPAETEIPLNLETPKKSAATEGIIGKVIYSLAILTLLAGGLFYFLRKYSLPKNAKTQAQIKVLSQHHFGPKRSLAMVRVAGETILIGITDQNINLVKSLSLLDEDIPEDTPKNFSATLNDQVKVDSETTQDEDFAISGIKDIVHRRLKSMRNFQ